MEKDNQKGIQKTIYLDKEAWAIMSGLMVKEKRSLSDVINSSLRTYLGLDHGGEIRIYIDGKEEVKRA